MAHFAEIDENNVVIRVVVIANKDTVDENGVEQEHVGVAFCQKLFGGNWKQASYNKKIRKRYPGRGYTYNAELDAFVAPKPFPSWILNNETADWDAPVPEPEEGIWSWDENSMSWVEDV